MQRENAVAWYRHPRQPFASCPPSCLSCFELGSWYQKHPHPASCLMLHLEAVMIRMVACANPEKGCRERGKGEREQRAEVQRMNVESPDKSR